VGAYYNEIEPFAAQWLRNLIAAGHIAPGDVDERSIEDVYPDDLRGYTQCHFFAGIGVWSYALRRAGWPDDRPVWTGSCPCQPFSSAGKGAAFDDERHLWPAFHHLIKECRPAALFGEQVASRDADTWIDLVQDDLEAMGYAVGAVPFPSAGVGAPHIRDRLYWMAYADHSGRLGRRAGQKGDGRDAARVEPQRLRNAGGLADAERERVRPCGSGSPSGETGAVQGIDGERQRLRLDASAGDDGMGARPGPTNGFWRVADWLGCRDGKWRPVEPGTFPLANGAASRMVYTCAICKTETVKRHEGLRTVRSFSRGNAGLHTASVLFNEVLRAVDNGHPYNASTGALPSPVQVCSDEMRTLRERASRGAPPPGWQRYEQRAREYREALSQVPRGGASTAKPSDANVQSLRQQILGTTLEKQHLFCPVCAGMGPHQCGEEVDGGRVGKLRAYGNAINAEAARVFIESAMDCMP
jgi:DNA (cytosine-5)-methyltransferase 1